MDEATTDKIKRLTEFKDNLRKHDRREDEATRAWLNRNVRWVRREVIEAGCHHTLTISPPPAVGGLIMRNVDPFDYLFEPIYLQSLNGHIHDMIDKTIGALTDPVQATRVIQPERRAIRAGYAFIAMAIDRDDHQLVDVHEAIKDAAAKCGITAERVDEVESNDRITDRILESLQNAEYVIVDLTGERPNVFFEAGYAHALNKTPIYVARHGTQLHFDIKDYPIIFFRNMRELKDGIVQRLQALASKLG